VSARPIDAAARGVQTGDVRVQLESRFPCSAEQAWAEVQKVSLLSDVARPLVTFSAPCGESLPERWVEGATVRIRSRLFGVVPLGTRALTIERIDQQRRVLRTRESDPLIRRWDHSISVSSLSGVSCLYRDEVEIQAGLFTLAVWLFAHWFFRHRHRRWKRVADRLRARPYGVTSPREHEQAREHG
jgi:hypothetical protein